MNLPADQRPPINLPDFADTMRAQNSGGNFSDKRAFTTAWLEQYIGMFSNPSKMPGFAYGLPAVTCDVGGKLRGIEGTVCNGCYAMKGAYIWTTTAAAYWRRFDRLGIPFWAEAIAEILNRRYAKGNANSDVFRWHDSGDIQSVDHLANIVKVAKLCPDIRFWIPTREYKLVAEYRKLTGDDIPTNLAIRMSAHKLGGFAPSFDRPLVVSTVSDGSVDGAHECPARFQDNSCGDCRACWDTEIVLVNYHLH